MDFRSMKRRELQELCKKHGLKANDTNLAMADSLAAFFEIQERKTAKGCLKVNGNGSNDVIKKVSFSLHEEGLENPIRSQRIITRTRAGKEIEGEETELGIRVVIAGRNDMESAHSKLKKSGRKMNTEERLESPPRRRVNQDHKSGDSVCQIQEALTRRSTRNSSKSAQEHEITTSNKDVDPARAKRSRKRFRDHAIDEKSVVAAEISDQQDVQLRRSARVASSGKPAKLNKSEKLNAEQKLESPLRRRSKRVNQDHKSGDAVCQIEVAETRCSARDSSKITAHEPETMASNEDVDSVRAKRSRKRLRDHADEKSVVALEISDQDARPRRSDRVASSKKPANLSALQPLPKRVGKTKNSDGRRQVPNLEDASKTIEDEPTDGNIGMINVVALNNDKLLEESSPLSPPASVNVEEAMVCNSSPAKLCEAKQDDQMQDMLDDQMQHMPDDQMQDMLDMNVSIQKTVSTYKKDEVQAEVKTTFTGSFDVKNMVNDQDQEERCHESPKFDVKDRGLAFDLAEKHLDIEIASTGQGGSLSCLVNHLNDDYSSPVDHSTGDCLTHESTEIVLKNSPLTPPSSRKSISDLCPSPCKVEYSKDQKVSSSTASGDELHEQTRGSLSAPALSERHGEQFMSEESEQLTRYTSNMVCDKSPHCNSVNNGSMVEMTDFEESFSKVDFRYANVMESHMKSCAPSDNLNADFFEGSSSIGNKETRTIESAASPEEVLLHQGSSQVEVYKPSTDDIAEKFTCGMVFGSEDIVARAHGGNYLAQNIENVEKALEKAEKLRRFLSWRSLSFHHITENNVEELGVELSPKEITCSLETTVSSSCGSRKSFNLLEVENFVESSKGAVLTNLDSTCYEKQPNWSADCYSAEVANASEIEKLDCEAAEDAGKEECEAQNVQITSLIDTDEFEITGVADNLSPVLGTASLDIKGEERLPEKVSLGHGNPMHKVVSPDLFISQSVPVERKAGDALKISHPWQSLSEDAGVELLSMDLECTRETDELVYSYNNVEFSSHECIECKAAHSNSREETTQSEEESIEFERCLGMADQFVCSIQKIDPSTAEEISSAGRVDDVLVGGQSVKQGLLEHGLETEDANFSDTADEVRTGDRIPGNETNILDECNCATAPRSLILDATHLIINEQQATDTVLNENYVFGEQEVEENLIPKSDCAFLGISTTGVAEITMEETPQNIECNFNSIESAGFEEATRNCNRQVAGGIEHGPNSEEKPQSVGDTLHEEELHGHARSIDRSEVGEKPGNVMRDRSEFGNNVKSDDIEFTFTHHQGVSEVNIDKSEAVTVENAFFDTEAAHTAAINDFSEAFEIKDESKSGNAVNKLIHGNGSEVPKGHTDNSTLVLLDQILDMCDEEANITSEIILTKEVPTEANGKPDIHAEREPEEQMGNLDTAYVEQNPLNYGGVIDGAAKSSSAEPVMSTYGIEFIDLPSENISDAFNGGLEYSGAVYSDQGPCTSSQTTKIASTFDEVQAVLSLDKSMLVDTKGTSIAATGGCRGITLQESSDKIFSSVVIKKEDTSIAATDGCKEITLEESSNKILSTFSVVINKLSCADVSQVAATGDQSNVPSGAIEMANMVSETKVAQAITFGDDGKNSMQDMVPVIVSDELSGHQAEEDARYTIDLSLKFQPLAVELEDTNGSISMDEMDELNCKLSKFQISSALKIKRLLVSKTPNKPPINKVTQINNTQGNDKENAKGKKTDRFCVRNLSKPMTPLSARKPLQIVDCNNR